MLSPMKRVIMISGANRGIGLASAQVLAKAGYRLSFGARDPGSIDTSSFDCEAIVSHWDAMDSKSSKLWVEQTKKHFGQIDGVVMNAGVLMSTKLEVDNDEAYETMWQTNFMGPLRLIRFAMPELRRSPHGRVVNIVSLAGKRLMNGGILGYSASKFASIALTHAIRHEGWDDNVRATSICPGLVDTDMVANVIASEGSFKIAPETVAETVAYALSLPNEAVVAEILINSRLEPMF